jgi:glucose-6-phosphate isomerase
MATDQLRVSWKNVLDSAVGAEHGLKEKELDRLAPRVGQIVDEIQAQRQAGKLPYRDLPYREDLVQGVEAQTAVFKRGCENLVVLGIGGSALGNIALHTALRSPAYNLLPAAKRGGPRLFVMDNVDPVQFGSLLDVLADQLDETLFNVISKSGETAETAAQFLIIRDMLIRRLGVQEARRRIIAITDASSGTMRRIVEAEGYSALPVPEGVGGRFSVLSPVGLFSAAMCGIDIRQLLAGAADMDRRVRGRDPRRNPAAILAAVHWLMFNKGKKLHVMMPYSYQLKDLADWFRQLWAESLGKQKSLDGRDVFAGPTPIKALGTTDQHSQVQLYREGPNDKVITFLAVERFERDVPIPEAPPSGGEMAYLAGHSMAELINAEREATEQALVASGRPCLRVIFPRINEATVGQFLYLYETATSIAGALFGINPYDQPAVELGKKYTFALMGRTGYEKVAAQLREQMRVDAAYLV